MSREIRTSSKHCTYPGKQVFSLSAVVDGAERMSWVVQVAVQVLVQSHQPFLLLLRLVWHGELRAGGKETENNNWN